MEELEISPTIAQNFKVKFIDKSLVLLVVCFLVGCVTPRAITFDPSSLRERQTQTRMYKTKDEISLLSAGVAVLQDMGYSLDATETAVGVIVASKTVDARNIKQMTAYFALSLLSDTQLSPDYKQKIRVSFITFPLRHKKNTFSARVVFQRVTWNTNNQISRVESLRQAKFYEEFFAKLSKSIFLEGHKI